MSGSARPKRDMAGWVYAELSHEELPTLSGAYSNKHDTTLSLCCGFLDSEATAWLRLDTTRPMADTVGEMLRLGIGLARVSSSSCCHCLPRSPVICKL